MTILLDAELLDNIKHKLITFQHIITWEIREINAKQIKGNKCKPIEVQLCYYNDKLTLHTGISPRREGFWGEGIIYPDCDHPELYGYMRDCLIEHAANQLGLKGV